MNYSIIGNSFLSVKIAEEIRKADSEAEIILFCPEGVLPYHRYLLSSVLLGAKVDQMICAPEDFYALNRIKLVVDKKIAKVHPKRKRVLTEEKEQTPFDILVIEDGWAFTLPDIKGVQKQGVFHLKTYADAGKAVDYLGLTEIAVVEVDNIIALQSACHLRNLGKETIVVVPSDHLLSDILDKDVADYLTEQLQRLGVRFVFNNGIVEVLGDGEAKAIRLKTGKVLESQMVVFSQADKNLSLLNTDDLLKEETDYFIKYEDVYCAKDLKSHLDRSIWEDFFIGRYALGGQGKNIAAAFFKQPNSFIEAPLERSFDLEGLSVALLGSAKRNDHTVAYMKVDYRMDAYKKIFVQEEVVKGAALINHQADAGALVQLINDQKSIKGIGMSVVDYPRTA